MGSFIFYRRSLFVFGEIWIIFVSLLACEWKWCIIITFAMVERSCPNVSFLAHQFLSIPSSQIETKWIFNIVEILTNLHWCWLNVQNIDKLIMILNNWPNDAWTGYCFLVTMGMTIFLKTEDKLLDNFEEELEDIYQGPGSYIKMVMSVQQQHYQTNNTPINSTSKIRETPFTPWHYFSLGAWKFYPYKIGCHYFWPGLY